MFSLQIKLVLPLLVVLLVSTESESQKLGRLFGKRPSGGFSFADLANKILSKLPFKIPGFGQQKPVSPTSIPSPDGLPSFCSKHDCPRFYEKINASDYTLRCYPKPYKWVSTTVEGKTKSFKLLNNIVGST